jgi:DNA repair protein SbcC/Rad50
MIPTELSLRNFMCYRENGDGGTLALSFDGLHVVCLSGENGAGKSALLDAITWALWGRARIADDDLIAQGASEMFVELTFQLGEQQYRVSRRRQRGRTGPRGGQAAGKGALDLHIRDNATWRPIAEASMRETQEQINHLLRMSYDTFINASFLLQGRADEFTARTPAERKQVLADILDLGVYERLEERAKLRARAADDQVKGLRGRIDELTRQAGEVEYWKQNVADVERRVSELEQRVRVAQTAREAAEQELRTLEAQAAERKAILQRLSDLRAEQARRDADIAAVHTRITAAESLVARREAIMAGVRELAAARAERERLEEVRGRYFELAEQRSELKQQLREALDALRMQQTHAEQRLAALRDQAARRAELVAAIAADEAQLAELRPLTLERSDRVDALQQIEARLQLLDEGRRVVQQFDERIKLRQDSLVAAREEARRTVERLNAQLAAEPRWHTELAAAQVAAHELMAVTVQLEALRRQAQVTGELAGEQRASCRQLQEQAEQLKARQALLGAGMEVCPICMSPLGADGLHRVEAHYSAELQDLRERYTAAKRAADAGTAQGKELEREVSALDARCSELRRQAASAELLSHQIAQATTWRDELITAQATWTDLAAQLEAGAFEPALQAERTAILGEIAAQGDPAVLLHERRMLAERISEIDMRLRTLDQIEGKLSVQRDAFQTVDTALTDRPAAEAALAEITTRIVGNDYAHDVRQRGRDVEAALAALNYSDADYDAVRAQAQALSHWDTEQRELERAEERLAADRTIVTQYEQLSRAATGEVERLIADETHLELVLRDLPRVQAQLTAQTHAMREAETNYRAAQRDLGEKEGYLRKAESAARDLEEVAAEVRLHDARRSLFAELAEACGKKGVQAMLIETAIPQIEDEANRLLARMTDNQMHLTLETQSETKKGDTVETLEIKIADALGTRVYDAFSGGEALRANFAVRIALSRLLARRAGARLETLVIDEGFGALDAIGRERMVEAITTVQDDFRRIVVITHIDELKDRFPATIEVSKTPLGSRWELR